MSFKDSVVMQVFRGEDPARIPVWFMRQAGRYLPEYQEIRARHSMLDVIRTPELAAEVTLQPLRRFELDAGIIFADILNPLIGMGIELDFVEGTGPVISNPVSSRGEIERLLVPAPEENVPYTLKAIRQVSSELTPRNIPLFGFAGAPFTLSSYLIEGSSSKNLEKTKALFRGDIESWRNLQEKLLRLVEDYLVAQVEAGASAVQIFDSWVGHLAPVEFSERVVPDLAKLVHSVKARTSVPILYFGTMTAGLLPHFRSIGADGYGIDWRSTLSDARKLIGDGPVLQGNLDPSLLSLPAAGIDTHVHAVLKDGRVAGRHIFNVGHGLLPTTSIDTLSRVIEVVRGGA